jgi:hypothetical protein
VLQVLTLMLCIPALINITALLVLCVFIYSVLGVRLFTYVAHQSHLTDDNNFDTLAHAALLLFQCLTGDGWGILMIETSVPPESGRCSESDGDCGSWFAIPYFVSFQIIGAFVFLNLVVAVMIEAFTELSAELAEPLEAEPSFMPQSRQLPPAPARDDIAAREDTDAPRRKHAGYTSQSSDAYYSDALRA